MCPCTKNASCLISVLGVELESSELEVTTASGLEAPLLVYLFAPLLVTKQVLLRPGPVGGWRVRKSSYMKSGRVLHVELGFTNTRDWLSEASCLWLKSLPQKPLLPGRPSGCSSVLIARDSTDPILVKQHTHPLNSLQRQCLRKCNSLKADLWFNRWLASLKFGFLGQQVSVYLQWPTQQ